MAESYVGTGVLRAIIDVLRGTAELAGVQIELGWPGEGVEAESIYPAPVETDVNVPTSRAGTRDRDELMAITLEIRVASMNTLDDTHGRLGELIGAVDEAVAQADTLADHENVVELELIHITHVVGGVGQGFLGFADLDLAVHTRVP